MCGRSILGGSVIRCGTRTGRTWTPFDPEFVGDVLDPDRASAMWAGHRWFAYDLIRWGRPELVVELGTQYGPSFFTFCQAVRDEGCVTSLHAVDTWKGDAFTGCTVTRSSRSSGASMPRRFADLDTHLHRCLFRDALDDFAPESIDLLHIDGCHDYDSVADDYESWLPKVAQDGMVLLHDVDPDTDMGSARFWKELASGHPSIEFTHSLGLGVLFPKGTGGFEYLFSDEFTSLAALLREPGGPLAWAACGYRDQTRMIDERDALSSLEQDRPQRPELRRSRAAGELDASSG